MFHELETEGPRLRHLGELLAEAYLPPDELSRAQRLMADIEVLSTQLRRLVMEAEAKSPVGRGDASEPEGAVVGMEAFGRPDMPAGSSTLSMTRRTPSPDIRYRRKKRKTEFLPVILPPSPEKAQKRQDSYSIH